MFLKSRKPVEITAPTADISFHYPPPAHLLQQQQQQQKPIVQRHVSHPTPVSQKDDSNSSKESYRSYSIPYQPKEEKKRKFSLFKKKKKSTEDSTRRATRTPDALGRKQVILNYPDSAPLTRRPHSSASNRDDLQRHGSQRSIKSNEFLDDEDEIDAGNDTHYPHFVNPQLLQPPRVPSTGGEGYDSLNQFTDIANRPRSTSMRVEKSKRDPPPPPPHRVTTVPQRPAPPIPSGRHHSQSPPKLELTTPTSVVPSVGSVMGTSLPMVPGLVGIKNHGNTCFMNAVLQCLSNTEQFLYYLLSGDCQKDLASLKRKKKKKGATSLPGGNTLAMAPPSSSSQDDVLLPDCPGAVTDSLIFLVKSLWNGQYEARVSAVFKELVGLWAEQYRGRNQHDAQEFLLWLLGYLHDNLSLASRQQFPKVCMYTLHYHQCGSS